MSLLAIDIGSSACKVVAFTADGEILGRHACSYAPNFPAPGHAELDPEHFWNAACTGARAVAKDLSDPVRALSLSSHGETFIPVNQVGEPIAPAILNRDNRAIQETAWLEQQVGRKRLFETTGLFAHSMYPVPKILWLRKRKPEIFSSTARFVTPIGYILLRLGLLPYIDYSLASRYLAFDIRRRRWSDEILRCAGLNSEHLPVPVPADTIAGTLDASSSGQLGLPCGIPVVVGGHDQPCGALGVGVIGPGHVADSIGTYECVVAASDNPILTDTALAGSLNSYCHAVPEKFVTIAFFPSGIMVKWFHDLLYANGNAQIGSAIEKSEAEHYAELESNVPAGPTGLCITPNLIGTCNPDFNAHARGIISGLNPGTGRAQIYKGILEGLACELSQLTRMLAKAVGDFEDICVTGGGSRSALGLSLRAALTGKCLHVMRCPEAVCLGAAILAGVAAGEYGSIREAVGRAVREVAVVLPDPAIASAYAQQVERYQALRWSSGRSQQTAAGPKEER
jgi:xylulokinase